MSGEPWVILPTYNEAGTVAAMVAAALAPLADEDVRVLVLDDASPDGRAASRTAWPPSTRRFRCSTGR